MIIYFILGILFYIVIIPILESFVELVQVAIEKRKCKHALEIAKKNKEVTDLANPEEKKTHVIGFATPSRLEELEQDEDF